MPSLLLMVQSGGVLLCSGNVYSGTQLPIGGIQIKSSNSGIGPFFVGLPNPMTGNVNTFQSGGSLTSGGLDDAMEITPGQAYFIPKSRLISGVLTPRLLAPAASSGTRVYWECM